MPVRNGRGIRDHIHLNATLATPRALLYNDWACVLEGVHFRADVPAGVKATGVLTHDGTAPANNDTVTIGTVTYTFKTSLTAATTANEVVIGTADVSLTNLAAAINKSAGGGTIYGSNTLVNPHVSAVTTLGSDLVTVTARNGGASENAVATTEASTHLSWGAATLAGGVDASLMLGVAADDVLPADSTSLLSAGLDLTAYHDTSTGAVVASPTNVMQAGTWLVIKSTTGTLTGIEGVLSILRRRASGPF